MLCFPFVLMKQYLFYLVLFISIINLVNCDEICVFKDTCECVFTNGSVIDLTSLGSHNSARWSNLTAVKKEKFTYFYNPCFGFSLGNSGCAKEVSVCQVSLDKKNYYDIGDAKNVNFLVENGTLKLLYHSSTDRTTTVSLVCSEEAVNPQLTVQGEVHPQKYAMTLTTRCACPDLCRTSHLSTGSVLVILFTIFVILYLFLGIVHSSLTRGAHGWELLPHYEFWLDFPLLVRDGCVFVVSGCKSETAYERI